MRGNHRGAKTLRAFLDKLQISCSSGNAQESAFISPCDYKRKWISLDSTFHLVLFYTLIGFAVFCL